MLPLEKKVSFSPVNSVTQVSLPEFTFRQESKDEYVRCGYSLHEAHEGEESKCEKIQVQDDNDLNFPVYHELQK